MFWKKYSIYDLRKKLPARFEDIKNSFAQYRKNFKILIVDDKHVIFSDTLKSLGYCVHEEIDIKMIDEAMRFDLVLCDKQGVGGLMGAKGEGVFLAKKIKEANPFLPVILYSSATFTLDDYEAIRSLDDIISDAPDPETFANYVDGHIKKLLDPYAQWQRLHIELVKMGFASQDIRKVESDYVKQIINTSAYQVPESMLVSIFKTIGKDIVLKFAEQVVFHLLSSN